MNVTKIFPTSNHSQSVNINFTSNGRSYESNCSPKKSIRNTTCLFRNDVNWIELAYLMQQIYKDKEKVNVYDFACSDGSEAYTLAIALNETTPIIEKRNKFLPIMASDSDKEIIRYAKSGRINLTQSDIDRLNCYTNNYQYGRYNSTYRNYFVDKERPILINNDNLTTQYSNSYSINPYLKFATDFRTSDILTELSKINDEGNTVILCRNVFPYLNTEYLKSVEKLLISKLASQSMLILGDYDSSSCIINNLQRHFKCIGYNTNILMKI